MGSQSSIGVRGGVNLEEVVATQQTLIQILLQQNALQGATSAGGSSFPSALMQQQFRAMSAQLPGMQQPGQQSALKAGIAELNASRLVVPAATSMHGGVLSRMQSGNAAIRSSLRNFAGIPGAQNGHSAMIGSQVQMRSNQPLSQNLLPLQNGSLASLPNFNQAPPLPADVAALLEQLPYHREQSLGRIGQLRGPGGDDGHAGLGFQSIGMPATNIELSGSVSESQQTAVTQALSTQASQQSQVMQQVALHGALTQLSSINGLIAHNQV